MIVSVDVDVIGPVIVAVHLIGNDTVIVIAPNVDEGRRRLKSSSGSESRWERGSAIDLGRNAGPFLRQSVRISDVHGSDHDHGIVPPNLIATAR